MGRNASRLSTQPFNSDWRSSHTDTQLSHQIRRDEVTIWWASLSETQSRLGPQDHLLTADELSRAGWMASQPARDRWITSRASLRSILSGYLGLQALAVPISYGSLGKPELGSLSPVRFNLSHSADLAVFAVAWRKPVGIDIQRLRADTGMIDLAKWTFSDDAYRIWQDLPESERRLAFTRTWARKEAYLKGRGLGLVYPMRDLEIVESSTSDTVQIVDKHDSHHCRNWRIYDLAAPQPGFVAALAVDGTVSSLISRGWPDGSVRTTWRQQ